MNRKLLTYSLLGTIFYLLVLFLMGSSFAEYFKSGSSLFATAVEKTPGSNVKFQEWVISGSGFDADTRVVMTPDSGNLHALAGQLPLLGNANDLLIVDDRAYIANIKHGLQVIDIRNPTSPEVLKTFTLFKGGSALSVATEGGMMFVASGRDGVVVFPLDSAGNVGSEMQIIPVGGNAMDAVAADDFLYVASDVAGVEVINLQNFSLSREGRTVSRIETPGRALGLALVGQILCVNTHRSGLWFYDISNPVAPKYLSTINGRGNVRTFIAKDNVLCLGDSAGYISFFDIKDPTTPSLVGEVFLGGMPEDFSLVGDSLYCADIVLGLVALNIRNLSAPIVVGSVDVPGQARSLSIHNGYAYVASNMRGLQIVDLDRIAGRTELSATVTPGNVRELIVNNEWLYLTSHSELIVMHRSVSDGMKVVATLELGATLAGLVRDGDYLFIAAGRNGIRVVDISNPERPFKVAALNLPGSSLNLALYENSLYVAALSGGVHVVDVSFPHAPWLVQTLETKGKSHDLVTDGRYLYIATIKSGVQIFELIDGQAPVWYGEVVRQWPMVDFSMALSMQLHDGLLYLASGKDGVQIIDVNNPSAVQVVGSLALPGTSYDVELDGDLLYVSSPASGLFLVDVSNPRFPVNLGYVLQADGIRGVKPLRDGLLVNAGAAGLIAIARPQELTVSVEDHSSKLRIAVPESAQKGWYNLHISNQGKQIVLNGALSL